MQPGRCEDEGEHGKRCEHPGEDDGARELVFDRLVERPELENGDFGVDLACAGRTAAARSAGRGARTTSAMARDGFCVSGRYVRVGQQLDIGIGRVAGSADDANPLGCLVRACQR